jgi:RNA polymerase sigma factor (sigma-70 family)
MGADSYVNMSGTELLAEYRARGSQEAFAELLKKYANLVYSVARRRLNNDALVADVAQMVFTRLARAVPPLKEEGHLVGWLHRTTVHVSIDVLRAESRRKTREENFALMENGTQSESWNDLAPQIDEALDRLPDEDRRAILLRFFEKKPLREVGQALGVSEDAAKMRVSRAVGKLRQEVIARGVGCSALGLSALLLENAVSAAPVPFLRDLLAANWPKPLRSSGWSTTLSGPGKLLATAAAVLLVAIVGWRFLNTGAPEARAPERSPRLVAAATPVGRFRAVSRPAQDLQLVENFQPRLNFYLVDAVTGSPLPDAKVHAAYFYTGGQGEGHDLVTDSHGLARIPQANRGGTPPFNLFATLDNYVGRSVGIEPDMPRQYKMKLDPAICASGTVINEQGSAVSDVDITINPPQPSERGAERIDFQYGHARSDSAGRWVYTHIPRAVREITFVLSHNQYATTIIAADLAQIKPTNLVMVLTKGFTVSGVVQDQHGRPVPGASIRALTGYSRRTVSSDDRGQFVLPGVADYQSFTTPAPERNRDGATVLRGYVGIGEANLRLVVQAEGFAAQSITVSLTHPNNSVRCVLRPGQIFKGRIVDEFGNGIPDAIVRTDSDNHGIQEFVWFSQCDPDGYFTWDSAPAKPVLFWFEAPGYEPKRDVLLTADGSDYQIELKPSGLR